MFELGSKYRKWYLYILLQYRDGIFKHFRGPGIDSVSLCSLAGRKDNPIPTRSLAPKDFLKFQHRCTIDCNRTVGGNIKRPSKIKYMF